MNEIGLPTMQDGYLSWQDPESGEWMVLTPKGSPFTDGTRNGVPPAVSGRAKGPSRKTCEHCGGRYRNWRSPFGKGVAVA